MLLLLLLLPLLLLPQFAGILAWWQHNVRPVVPLSMHQQGPGLQKWGKMMVLQYYVNILANLTKASRAFHALERLLLGMCEPE
jgi:hypothetical protein